MNRKEFIEKLGLGAAFVLTSTCLGSCGKDDEDVTPSGSVDFTLDLTASENSNLTNNGGYIIRNNVVVAKDMNGNYVAATQACSHEGTKAIILQNNEWYCTDHGAKFDLTGNGLNANGSRGLTIYNTSLSGNSLRIYS